MASKGPGGRGGGVILDAKTADRLLDLLSTDDEFRSLFQKDPRQALIDAGYDPPAEVRALAGKADATEDGYSCFRGALASKEKIAATRLDIKSSLMTALSQSPPLISR